MDALARKTRKTHARGTRLAQPLASSVLEGTLYFVTDEGVIERSNGTIWESYSGAGGGGTVINNNYLTMLSAINEFEEPEYSYIIPGSAGAAGAVGAIGPRGIQGINGLDGIDGENIEIIIQGSPTGGGSTVPGGSSGQVQFNNGGVFGGDSDLTFSGDTVTATKVSTPDIISAGAVTITPNAGSNLNIVLSTTGDLAVNTSQLYVDTSAASVGVNTSVPRAILDVLSGSANSNGDAPDTLLVTGVSKTPNTTGTGNIFIQSNTALAADAGGSLAFGARYLTGSAAAAYMCGLFGAKENATSSNLAGYLSIWTRSGAGAIAEKVRITSTGLVGIGTTTIPSTLTVNGPINLKNYTVATLPAGTRGDIAYVTDALAPSFLAVLVGGGTVVTPCFYNGTNWVGF